MRVLFRGGRRGAELWVGVEMEAVGEAMVVSSGDCMAAGSRRGTVKNGKRSFDREGRLVIFVICREKWVQAVAMGDGIECEACRRGAKDTGGRVGICECCARVHGPGAQ